MVLAQAPDVHDPDSVRQDAAQERPDGFRCDPPAATYTAGGPYPIIHHQNVGCVLGDVAARIEACRYFCWKTAHYLDQHEDHGELIGAMCKIHCTELLFDAVFKCDVPLATRLDEDEQRPTRHADGGTAAISTRGRLHWRPACARSGRQAVVLASRSGEQSAQS